MRIRSFTDGLLVEIYNDLILAHRCRRGPSTPTAAGVCGYGKSSNRVFRTTEHGVWVPAFTGTTKEDSIVKQPNRHCERSEAIHPCRAKKEWIASLRSQ